MAGNQLHYSLPEAKLHRFSKSVMKMEAGKITLAMRIAEKTVAQACMRQVMRWEFSAFIPCHGPAIVTGGAQAQLAAAAADIDLYDPEFVKDYAMTTVDVLEPFNGRDDIWTYSVDLVIAGASLGNRSTIIRVPREGNPYLVVISPAALNDAVIAAIKALGPVEHLVSPSDHHHISIPAWQKIWPDVAVHMTARTKAQPEQANTKNVHVIDDANPLPDLVATGVFDAVVQMGLKGPPVIGDPVQRELWILHRPSATVAVGDQCFYAAPEEKLSFFSRNVLGMVSGMVTVPFFVRDEAEAKASMHKVLAWDIEGLIPIHGKALVTAGAKAHIQRAATATLKGL